MSFPEHAASPGHAVATHAGAAPEIDLMTEDDLDAVTWLEERVQPFPWRRALFADSLRASHAAWVLRRAGALRGFMLILPSPGETHLLNIAVTPAQWGQGFGKRLLRFGMDWSARQGAKRMFLETRPSNERARALYRHLGFTEIGLRKAYYPAHDGREDGLVLCRGLEDLLA
ncbi:MAG: ribosomal protein S18-alanine N-acetyltransferase [Zoogloeaceae bacterium]|jgi:ribosomal-protein-alanine N-acetyltransferase|nr:ribosomal protein S18-alanine N-acetyltransferase [Zoogloeaceae bacterium]